MKNISIVAITVTFLLTLVRCEQDPWIVEQGLSENTDGPTPHYLKVPPGFPDYFLAKENQLTEEGIALGKKLFFDPILSKNENVSCGSCHFQSSAFSDPSVRSIGTNGTETRFHSMPLFNMAWMNEFFWNGRAKSREAQALQPVTNPMEMDLTWPEAVARLQANDEYPEMFFKAFGTRTIDSMLVAKAMVQFEMTLVSADSKFDKWLRGEVELTEQEQFGQILFNSERADCFHCHGSILATDNSFHNNGLDGDDALQGGLMEVTGNQQDLGKFKTPTLRNLVFTAPYMHDGRFSTLEEVIDFYSEGVRENQNIDVLMEFAFQGGVQLEPNEKAALIAFLLTMTDSTFVVNPDFSME